MKVILLTMVVFFSLGVACVALKPKEEVCDYYFNMEEGDYIFDCWEE